jgi:hypothetical protein
MSFKFCSKKCDKHKLCKRSSENKQNIINSDDCLSGGNFALFEPFTCGDCIWFNVECEVCVNGQSIFCGDFRGCSDEPCYVFNRFEEEL